MQRRFLSEKKGERRGARRAVAQQQTGAGRGGKERPFLVFRKRLRRVSRRRRRGAQRLGVHAPRLRLVPRLERGVPSFAAVPQQHELRTQRRRPFGGPEDVLLGERLDGARRRVEVAEFAQERAEPRLRARVARVERDRGDARRRRPRVHARGVVRVSEIIEIKASRGRGRVRNKV